MTAWGASEKYMSALNTVNVFGGLAGSSAWSGEPMNVLIVGSDERDTLTRAQRRKTGIERGDAGRHTDTILLAHIGGDLGKVTVVSLPRDSLVDIPAHTGPDGKEIKAYRGKINSAFGTGGAATTVQAVQNATGLTIDHYVEIDFGGFLKTVNAVGGVDICRGPDALAFVRARYIDNDFGRTQRQQTFLSALAQKVSSSEVLLNPIAMNSLMDAVASSITTDERLNRDDMAAIAARAAELDLGNITFTTVPVSDGDHFFDGESTVLWDPEAAPADCPLVPARVFDALREDQPIPKPAKAKPVEVPPGDIKVAVIGDGAQAEQAVADLTEAGYQVSQQSGSQPVGETRVEYDPAWPKSLETIKASLPEVEVQKSPGSGEVFRIYPGADYSGLQPVRAAATSVESTVRKASDSLC